ncbi:hypothetical protein RYX36_030014 [Vicia faba]
MGEVVWGPVVRVWVYHKIIELIPPQQQQSHNDDCGDSNNKSDASSVVVVANDDYTGTDSDDGLDIVLNDDDCRDGDVHGEGLDSNDGKCFGQSKVGLDFVTERALDGDGGTGRKGRQRDWLRNSRRQMVVLVAEETTVLVTEGLFTEGDGGIVHRGRYILQEKNFSCGDGDEDGWQSESDGHAESKSEARLRKTVFQNRARRDGVVEE